MGANVALVAGQTVRLERDVSETDRYGRLLRYGWVGDLMVNTELVRLGYARGVTYPPDVKYQELFDALEREAREEGRGLWTGAPTATPTPAWDDCAYIGNANTGVFHWPSCDSVNRMAERNKVCLGSREEAIERGFRPCQRCNS